MSIQSEITRISGNVSDALSAIADKGVTVPSGSNSDDLADLIALIQQGSGNIVIAKSEDSGGGEIVTITTTDEIDISSDTVAADKMLYGITAHNASGEAITGTIVTKTGSDLTASAATVTVPAGYYASSATKSVDNGSATTPATTITANPAISVSSGGLITATAAASSSVTPTVSTGYVSSGTAGTITVSGSATEQLSTQAAQTIHPSSSDQTIASGKYLTGAQTIKGVLVTNLSAGNIKKDVVVKIGDSTDDDCVTSVTGSYEGGGGGQPNLQAKTNIDATTSSQTITADDGYDGLSSVQINALDGLGAQTIHPSTSDQTIASGKYLTGAQTIAAVTLENLTAANIKKDVVVKIGDADDDDCVASITGTYESSGCQFKSGTYIPAATYSSTGSRQITTIETIGFTPKKFILGVNDRNDIYSTQYAIIRTTFESYGSTPVYARSYTRYQNTSGSLGQAGNLTSWTSQSAGYLYLSDGIIYYRSATNCILVKDVEYSWYAYGS